MAVGRIQTEGDLARFVDQRFALLAPTIRQIQSSYLSGSGVPSGAPPAPRALRLSVDGGVGSTAYVWEGSAWRAL